MTQGAYSSSRRLASDSEADQDTRPRSLEVVAGQAVDLTHEQLELDLRERGNPRLDPHEGLLGASQWGHLLKRSLDVILASVTMLALAPVFFGAALLVRLTSRGPIFHIQERVGRDGKSFRFMKFRTMQINAHEMRDDLEAHNESDGPIFKIRNDPRITKVGRVLRKLSIDELPQLLHVLTGQMSLVGPRPPLPEEVETYSDGELQRLLVKPGITCIWQVSGRSDLDFGTWVRMDLQYIREWTPWVDVKLLALTIPAVLTGRGAY